MGKDYLVKGAKLMCVSGMGIIDLDIPKGHGYDKKDGKKKIVRTVRKGAP